MPFSGELFLGFPVDPVFKNELKKANAHLVAAFIQGEGDQENGDYLCEVMHQGMQFFGKFLGKIAELQQIELLEMHIYSVLKKLVPNFPYEEIPLYVFPIEKSHEPS